MSRLLPWGIALSGFFLGAILAFFVLDVCLGMPDAGGSKLSVVIALAPAIAGYDLASRLIEGILARTGRG